VKFIWNNSYKNCGCRWKWRMIIAVNFPIKRHIMLTIHCSYHTVIMLSAFPLYSFKALKGPMSPNAWQKLMKIMLVSRNLAANGNLPRIFLVLPRCVLVLCRFGFFFLQAVYAGD